MAKKGGSDVELIKRIPKASTPTARELQIAAAAYDLAEKRILDGSASDGLLREFIKIGSPKEQTERAILEEQRKLIAAKTAQIESTKKVEDLYIEAIGAFKSYRGGENDNEDIF